MQYRAALSRISHAKSHKQSPAEMSTRRHRSQLTTRLAVIYRASTRTRCAQANALDFDDLLLEAVRLLASRRRPRASAYNRRLRVPDDRRVSGHQSQPVRADAAAHRRAHRTSAWSATRTSPSTAGAAPTSATFWISSAIIPSATHHPPGAELPLDQEHSRSRQRAWSPTTRSATASGCGPTPARATRSASTQAPTPRTKRCSSPTPSSALLARNPDERVAVLYRTNFQSRQIEEALRRYGRKYIVVGGFSFYQRAEVKDILAYLKVAAQPAGFHQPAAHHQHAGARHRQDHRRADRAVRARRTSWLCGRRIGRMLDENAVPGPRAKRRSRRSARMMEELADGDRRRGRCTKR